MTGDRTLPLDGVRVLAVENYLAGPYGSMLLADFGAEVIKIEPPGGDTYRLAAPRYRTDDGEMSYSFLRVNRNKKSAVLDLKSAAGREDFLALASGAQVVWANLRPGSMDRLGLGWTTLQEHNPALVYASISGFGLDDLLPAGPYQDMPAFDIVAQAMSGMMMRVGEEGQAPLYLGVPVADQLAGTMAAWGVTLALRAAEAGGQGRRVDVSMYDVMVAFNEQAIGHFAHFGETPQRGLSPTSSPYGAFRCADGWVAIGIASDEIWARFCRVIERPDLVDAEGMTSGISRSRNQEARLRPIIESWAAERTAAAIAALLSAAGVPAGPVQDVPDLFTCPQVAAREMLIDLDDPVAGRLTVAGNPVKISGATHGETRTAPQLGADQAYVEQLVRHGRPVEK